MVTFRKSRTVLGSVKSTYVVTVDGWAGIREWLVWFTQGSARYWQEKVT